MYQDDYHYTSAGSKAVVWFIFFIPCAITGLISYFVSHHLDKQIYGNELPPQTNEGKSTAEIQKELKESASFGGKILGLMIAIVVVILLLQYFIQSTA
jgi:hypothetical protein